LEGFLAEAPNTPTFEIFSMRRLPLAAGLVVALASLAACDRTAPPAPSTQAAAPAPAAVAKAIAWRHGDVDDAFAEARESGRPVLLYWGAVWCPPCNKLKATLFQDPAFIALTGNFIPVYLDGDLPGAQAWGEEFGVRGYPTLVVLTPDRQEITRVAGGNDSAALVDTLKRAAGRRASVASVLQNALATPQSLSADDWAVLADYGWEVDANRLAGEQAPEKLLRGLAAHAPTPQLQRRFTLLALASGDSKAKLDASDRAVLSQVLADPAEVHANQSVLTYAGADLIARATQGSTDANALGAQLLAALQADAGAKASAEDRLGWVLVEIDLFRQQQPEGPLPAPLVAKTKAAVAAVDAASHTAYERQAIISTAAYALQQAGDDAGAEKLLKDELPRSHTPYYYMPDLAELAEKRGDKAAAIEWLRKAYEGAQGPATRVQWGVLYVEGLVRLTPDDAKAIEAATAQVVGELGEQPEGYHQRTRQRFEKLGKTLAAWSREHGGAQTLARLKARTEQACKRPTTQAADDACSDWLRG